MLIDPLRKRILELEKKVECLEKEIQETLEHNVMLIQQIVNAGLVPMHRKDKKDNK